MAPISVTAQLDLSYKVSRSLVRQGVAAHRQQPALPVRERPIDARKLPLAPVPAVGNSSLAPTVRIDREASVGDRIHAELGQPNWRTH